MFDLMIDEDQGFGEEDDIVSGEGDNSFECSEFQSFNFSLLMFLVVMFLSLE